MLTYTRNKYVRPVSLCCPVASCCMFSDSITQAVCLAAMALIQLAVRAQGHERHDAGDVASAIVPAALAAEAAQPRSLGSLARFGAGLALEDCPGDDAASCTSRTLRRRAARQRGHKLSFQECGERSQLVQRERRRVPAAAPVVQAASSSARLSGRSRGSAAGRAGGRADGRADGVSARHFCSARVVQGFPRVCRGKTTVKLLGSLNERFARSPLFGT